MNEMNKIERKCKTCGFSKLLEVGNFKRIKNTKFYTEDCRKCIDKKYNDIRNAKNKAKRAMKPALVLFCANEKCKQMFKTKNTRRIYCCKKCSLDVTYQRKRDSGVRVSNKNQKKIPEKFLVRGKISGVHY